MKYISIYDLPDELDNTVECRNCCMHGALKDDEEKTILTEHLNSLLDVHYDISTRNGILNSQMKTILGLY